MDREHDNGIETMESVSENEMLAEIIADIPGLPPANPKYAHLSDRQMDFRSHVKDIILIFSCMGSFIVTVFLSLLASHGFKEAIEYWSDMYGWVVLGVLMISVTLSIWTPLDREVRRRNLINWAVAKKYGTLEQLDDTPISEDAINYHTSKEKRRIGL